MQNPLLLEQTLPQFSKIEFEHIEPAIRGVIEQNEKALEDLLKNDSIEPSWGNLIQVLDNLEDRLSNIWSTVGHLLAVNNSPELRTVYERCQPLVSEYSINIAQNKTLFNRINRLAARKKEAGFSASQIKVIEDYLLDFELSGVNLDTQQQERFKELEKRSNQLSIEFSNNVLDATRAWSKHLENQQRLSGLPELALAIASQAAREKHMDGFLLTLDYPCYNAVITYADDESLRREMYTAYVTRASWQTENAGNWDNKTNIDEILQLRNERAQILGYKSYAELSLARKMAESPDKVLAFLNDLAEKGRPVAQSEYKELQRFASSLGKDEIAAWDVAYYSEKLRQKQFNISQEELRVYFPLEKTKKGLFEIVEKLYGIEIHRNSEYDTWHASIEAYDIYNGKQLIARFFFDLFTREGKRGGAWMSECRSRREMDNGEIQLPAAYLICNFSESTHEIPSLLTHTEVTTLFHEFGHGLHHLLTMESSLRVSGINGVAWDAVELPSQLMENWCWDKESIQLISSHYVTGEALPEAMLEKMLEARNFQSGMKLMRQLEFGLFDFELHTNLDKLSPEYVRKTMESVRKKTSVYVTPGFNRFENSFSHIFAGGYAAGYYSYFWAEVLSADVFSRFKETGVLNKATGTDFLKKVLSRGGAVKALSLFKDFMGREPKIDAFLEGKGIPAN